MRTTESESQVDQESVVLLRPLFSEAKLPYLAGFSAVGVLQIMFEDKEVKDSRMLQKALIGQKNYDLIYIRLLSKIDQDEEPKKIGKVSYQSNNVVEEDFLFSQYTESSSLLKFFKHLYSNLC